MTLLDQLEQWVTMPRADGAELTRADGSRIVILPRVTPIPTLSQLIDAKRSESAESIERFVTLEGEIAVIACGPTWAIAIVVVDVHAYIVSGQGQTPSLASAVRELARHAYAGLGAVRRRRYVYQPPPAWQGLARPYAARWLAPNYPRTRHALTVFDARPAHASASELADRLLITSTTHARAIDPPRPLAVVRTTKGLAGAYARIDFRESERMSIVRCTLRDAVFAYTAELAGPSVSIAQDLGTLERLVESIEPIAIPNETAMGDRVLYWGD